jgi:hypothetical protein
MERAVDRAQSVVSQLRDEEKVADAARPETKDPGRSVETI